MTHAKDAPCPFAADNFPKLMFGTCCSFDATMLGRQLEALDQAILTVRTHDDMSHGQALAFARVLAETAEHLEQMYAERAMKPRGAVRSGRWNEAEQAVEVLECSSFEEALMCIREGARWYEKVVGLGFGVDARA